MGRSPHQTQTRRRKRADAAGNVRENQYTRHLSISGPASQIRTEPHPHQPEPPT